MDLRRLSFAAISPRPKSTIWSIWHNNMIYAANKTYLRDGSGVDPAWRLINAKGEDFTCVMSQTRWQCWPILQFFNILNPEWQAYIFQTEIEALDAMGFDGWHGDTIGEYGDDDNSRRTAAGIG